VQFTNVHESNEAMTEVMSEHDHVISIDQFKEILRELVKTGNLLSFPGNLDRLLSFLRSPDCVCDPFQFNSRGQGNCNLQTRDFNGQEWCYLERFASDCSDARLSRELDGFMWSHAACHRVQSKPLSLSNSRFFSTKSSLSFSTNSHFFSNPRICFSEDGDSVCFNSNDDEPIQNAVDMIVTDAVDEIFTDAADKIVMKKAGIVGKLKTAKQNLIGHHGETISVKTSFRSNPLNAAHQFLPKLS